MKELQKYVEKLKKDIETLNNVYTIHSENQDEQMKNYYDGMIGAYYAIFEIKYPSFNINRSFIPSGHIESNSWPNCWTKKSSNHT